MTPSRLSADLPVELSTKIHLFERAPEDRAVASAMQTVPNLHNFPNVFPQTSFNTPFRLFVLQPYEVVATSATG